MMMMIMETFIKVFYRVVKYHVPYAVLILIFNTTTMQHGGYFEIL